MEFYGDTFCAKSVFRAPNGRMVHFPEDEIFFLGKKVTSVKIIGKSESPRSSGGTLPPSSPDPLGVLRDFPRFSYHTEVFVLFSAGTFPPSPQLTFSRFSHKSIPLHSELLFAVSTRPLTSRVWWFESLSETLEPASDSWHGSPAHAHQTLLGVWV